MRTFTRNAVVRHLSSCSLSVAAQVKRGVKSASRKAAKAAKKSNFQETFAFFAAFARK
jgi:hypothetical protein